MANYKSHKGNSRVLPVFRGQNTLLHIHSNCEQLNKIKSIFGNSFWFSSRKVSLLNEIETISRL